MTGFGAQFFKKSKFSKTQIFGYLANAFRDVEIATKDGIPEARFLFAYQALIKAGIACLAHSGVKVRAVPGHHIRILEKMSEFLKDPDVLTLGNAMRMKRNEDLYGEGGFVSEKESIEYLDFVRLTLEKAKAKIG